MENERYKLRRNVERYSLLLANITNPVLVKLLREMLDEAEAQLTSLDAAWRTEPHGAASLRISPGGDAPSGAAEIIATRSDIIAFGGWQLDPRSRRATSPAGKTGRLTRGEFELLLAFVRYPGQILSRKELVTLSQHRAADPIERTIDVLIGRLRQKLEADPRHPRHIVTVRSAGYIFEPAPRGAGQG